MKEQKILQIPDEIIKQLHQGECKVCGRTNPDLFGVFYPDPLEEWGGYGIILYPLCSDCLEQSSPSEIETILMGEFIFAQSCGDTQPFCGYQTNINA